MERIIIILARVLNLLCPLLGCLSSLRVFRSNSGTSKKPEDSLQAVHIILVKSMAGGEFEAWKVRR